MASCVAVCRIRKRDKDGKASSRRKACCNRGPDSRAWRLSGNNAAGERARSRAHPGLPFNGESVNQVQGERHTTLIPTERSCPIAESSSAVAT
jgi:hypothetical protein